MFLKRKLFIGACIIFLFHIYVTKFFSTRVSISLLISERIEYLFVCFIYAGWASFNP